MKEACAPQAQHTHIHTFIHTHPRTHTRAERTGDRFVGLAVTDGSNTIATPLEVIERVRRSGEKYKARVLIAQAGASYAARKHKPGGLHHHHHHQSDSSGGSSSSSNGGAGGGGGGRHATVTRRALETVPIEDVAAELQQSTYARTRMRCECVYVYVFLSAKRSRERKYDICDPRVCFVLTGLLNHINKTKNSSR